MRYGLVWNPPSSITHGDIVLTSPYSSMARAMREATASGLPLSLMHTEPSNSTSHGARLASMSLATMLARADTFQVSAWAAAKESRRARARMIGVRFMESFLGEEGLGSRSLELPGE